MDWKFLWSALLINIFRGMKTNLAESDSEVKKQESNYVTIWSYVNRVLLFRMVVWPSSCFSTEPPLYVGNPAYLSVVTSMGKRPLLIFLRDSSRWGSAQGTPHSTRWAIVGDSVRWEQHRQVLFLRYNNRIEILSHRQKNAFGGKVPIII